MRGRTCTWNRDSDGTDSTKSKASNIKMVDYCQDPGTHILPFGPFERGNLVSWSGAVDVIVVALSPTTFLWKLTGCIAA